MTIGSTGAHAGAHTTRQFQATRETDNAESAKVVMALAHACDCRRTLTSATTTAAQHAHVYVCLLCTAAHMRFFLQPTSNTNPLPGVAKQSASTDATACTCCCRMLWCAELLAHAKRCAAVRCHCQLMKVVLLGDGCFCLSLLPRSDACAAAAASSQPSGSSSTWNRARYMSPAHTYHTNSDTQHMAQESTTEHSQRSAGDDETTGCLSALSAARAFQWTDFAKVSATAGWNSITTHPHTPTTTKSISQQTHQR